MKHLIGVLAFAAVAGGAQAATFNFIPSDADLADLDHHHAYSWGIRFDIPTGEEITGATLRIENIWDWRVEQDRLFIDLLDDPRNGVQVYADNTNDNVISDYFATRGGVPITTWSDPVGGVNNGFDFVYSFTESQLALLTGFVTDSRPDNRADFGLAFDPDCHYYNSGIKFTITTDRANVPDAGATSILAGGAFLALAAFRRKLA